MKLHLGCGTKKKQGWVNIDSVAACQPDLVHDLTVPLPYADQSVDEILAEDLLEHFDKYARVGIFGDWARVLKVGGTITVQVPNFKKILFRYFKFKFNDFVDTVFGETMWNNEFYIGYYGNHKWGYSPESLSEFIKAFGIEPKSVETKGLNIRYVGVKKSHIAQSDIDNMIIYSHSNKGCKSGNTIAFKEAKQKIKAFTPK